VQQLSGFFIFTLFYLRHLRHLQKSALKMGEILYKSYICLSLWLVICRGAIVEHIATHKDYHVKFYK